MAERVHIILNAQGHCQYVRSPWPLRLIKCDRQSARIIKSQVTAAHYVRGTFIRFGSGKSWTLLGRSMRWISTYVWRIVRAIINNKLIVCAHLCDYKNILCNVMSGLQFPKCLTVFKELLLWWAQSWLPYAKKALKNAQMQARVIYFHNVKTIL